MSILITGGTGKTGLALASILHDANQEVVLTSRSGRAPEPFKSVVLDWWNPSTFENPFKGNSTIKAIYLIGPSGAVDMLTPVKPFIDLAVSKGVKRIVLLSAGCVPKGSPPAGQLHEYLDTIGIDYVALRPTWFMDNLAQMSGIRDNDQIVSVTKDGRIPLIAVEDIARAAFDAILSEKTLEKDIFVCGPELFSYDEVADILSELLGRTIIHKRISVEEAIAGYTALGIPADFATLLVNMEAGIAEGSEEARLKADNKVIGKTKLRGWLEQRKALWLKE